MTRSMFESDETSLERLSFSGSGEEILERLSLSSDSSTSHVTLKFPTLKAMAEKVGPLFMILCSQSYEITIISQTNRLRKNYFYLSLNHELISSRAQSFVLFHHDLCI
jgi:hypothetical protein